MMDEPGDVLDVSVVVPIAPGRAPLVLQSLEHAQRGNVRCEVITEVGLNPSRNRNQAIARSRGTLLAFTDDDCRVPPDWLANAVAFFRTHPDYDVVGGPQVNADGEGVLARASGYALGSWFGTYRQSRRYKAGRPRLDATQFDLSSANLFITRRAFDRWGPFDERLWPNEETALLRRIERAGGRIAYDPAIVVSHKRRDSLLGLARQCFGYGRGRACQAHVEGSRRPGLGQAVPGLFVAYILLLPALVTILPVALLPLCIYGVASVTVSIATAVARRDFPAALVMPPAFFVIHAAYPAGYLLEALRLLGRGPRLAAPCEQANPLRPAVTR